METSTPGVSPQTFSNSFSISDLPAGSCVVASAGPEFCSASAAAASSATLAATAAAVIAAEASALTKGPSSLTYNRNPVVCYYNIPVAEFVTSEDLRNAARAVNHAACLDPRDRVLSARVVNAITASCWGKEPFTFSWKPKAPAVYPPLGLAIDERSGQVTGTPRFHGEVAVLVTCTDADGFSSYTQLRFFCKDPPTGAALPLSPPIVLRSHPLEGI